MALIKKVPPQVAAFSGTEPARVPGQFLRRLVTGTLLVCTLPAAHAQVAVLGHAETGKYVIVSDRKDPSVAAAGIASKKAPGDGWKVLLESNEPGYGSMFCLRSNGATQFFVAAGKPTPKEAVSAAKSTASAAAAGTGQIPFWCGVWSNTNKHLASAAPGERATLTRNYDGVVLTYTLGTTKSGTKVVHVRGKNTLPGTAATVRFVGVEGAAGKMLVLQPGEGFTLPLGNVESFDVEIGRHAPMRAQKPLDDGVMEALQEVIREQINTKGNVIRSHSFIGKRG